MGFAPHTPPPPPPPPPQPRRPFRLLAACCIATTSGLPADPSMDLCRRWPPRAGDCARASFRNFFDATVSISLIAPAPTSSFNALSIKRSTPPAVITRVKPPSSAFAATVAARQHLSGQKFLHCDSGQADCDGTQQAAESQLPAARARRTRARARTHTHL